MAAQPKGFVEDFTTSIQKGKIEAAEFGKEIVYELTPVVKPEDKEAFQKNAIHAFHIPYFPAFHRPGWLSRYIFGPYDEEWLESIISDLGAGITVGLTLIPQGLSYATLANQQPIQGLYAAILPSAAYTFFGSSLQLAVGPVAVVSLITGRIVATFVPDFATNPDGAANMAAQLAFAVGITLIILSFFNLGNFIRYISHPVMSGFTSGAACTIGLSQLKNAFGFSNSGVPQQGQEGYEYSYLIMRWYRIHWDDRYNFTAKQLKKPTGASATASNILKWKKYVLREGHLYRNSYATKIFVGLVVGLLAINIIKDAFKPNAERRRKISYRIWTHIAPLFPFFGIIICANAAWRIKKNDHFTDPTFKYDHDYNSYYLKIVGKVPAGLDFIRQPKFEHSFNEILKEAIPLALIAYMESYSVARKIAARRGELSILNASQELWANGIANALACVSSAFPVSGSFSRSALNNACGARTPMSKVTTMVVVIIALKYLTETFQYIPQAALAAVIAAAIWNLISFSDLWEAWKNNKKDFFTMLFTWIFVLTYDTEVGLAAGLGVSAATLAYDAAFSDENKPVLIKSAKENNGLDVVRLRQDLNFLSGGRVRDFVLALTLIDTTAQKQAEGEGRFLTKVNHAIAAFFEQWFVLVKPKFVDIAPVGVVLDFGLVLTVDITGMQNLAEIQEDVRRYGIKVIVINATPSVEAQLIKYGILNDYVDEYAPFTGAIPTLNSVKKVELVQVQSGIPYDQVQKHDDEKESEQV